MEKFAEVLNSIWDKAKKTFKNGKRWVTHNYKIAIPAAAVVLIILVVSIIFIVKGINKNETTTANAPTPESETQQEIPTEVAEMPLEENAHEAVNTFVTNYYQALADGNMEVVTTYRSYTEETEKIKIQKKSNYIENYQNIICYTKPGPIENSYIAYVYYEVKFKDIDTLAPGLNSLYLYPDEEGNFKIGVGEMDEHIAEYLKQASAQDNVVDLFNQVQVKYNEAMEKDEKLATFLEELPTRLKTEVGEELAAAEATVSNNEATQPETEQSQEETAAEETPQQPQTVTVETVKTTTTVNVRSSDSETADKLGKAQSGSTYKRLEERANGWSKIEFEGKEAYIKTEFLEVVDTQTVEVTSEETANQESDNTLGQASDGKIIIKETVNIRKTASETGEKLGVAYRGDQYELVMKQADGWTKIKYKGKTAYVKSDYVQ